MNETIEEATLKSIEDEIKQLLKSESPLSEKAAVLRRLISIIESISLEELNKYSVNYTQHYFNYDMDKESWRAVGTTNSGYKEIKFEKLLTWLICKAMEEANSVDDSTDFCNQLAQLTKILLEKGVDVNGGVEVFDGKCLNPTPLYFAVQNPNLHKVVSLLVQFGACQSFQYTTALHIASQQENDMARTINALVEGKNSKEKKTIIEALDDFGCTPLQQPFNISGSNRQAIRKIEDEIKMDAEFDKHSQIPVEDEIKTEIIPNQPLNELPIIMESRFVETKGNDLNIDSKLESSLLEGLNLFNRDDDKLGNTTKPSVQEILEEQNNKNKKVIDDSFLPQEGFDPPQITRESMKQELAKAKEFKRKVDSSTYELSIDQNTTMAEGATAICKYECKYQDASSAKYLDIDSKQLATLNQVDSESASHPVGNAMAKATVELGRQVIEEFKDHCLNSGATFVSSLIFADDKKLSIVSTQLGDSSAFIVMPKKGGKGFETIPLTKPHTVTVEKTRITAAINGKNTQAKEQVEIGNRYCGLLVSRGLGDTVTGVGYHRYPTVSLFEMEVNEKVLKNSYLIQCSDGMTDTISDEKIAQIVSEQKENLSIATALCRKGNPNDDVTVSVTSLGEFYQKSKKDNKALCVNTCDGHGSHHNNNAKNIAEYGCNHFPEILAGELKNLEVQKNEIKTKIELINKGEAKETTEDTQNRSIKNSNVTENISKSNAQVPQEELNEQLKNCTDYATYRQLRKAGADQGNYISINRVYEFDHYLSMSEYLYRCSYYWYGQITKADDMKSCYRYLREIAEKDKPNFKLASVFIVNLEQQWEKKYYRNQIDFNNKEELTKRGVILFNDDTNITVLDYFVLGVLLQRHPILNQLTDKIMEIPTYTKKTADQVERELIEPLMKENDGNYHFSSRVIEIWHLSKSGKLEEEIEKEIKEQEEKKSEVENKTPVHLDLNEHVENKKEIHQNNHQSFYSAYRALKKAKPQDWTIFMMHDEKPDLKNQFALTHELKFDQHYYKYYEDRTNPYTALDCYLALSEIAKVDNPNLVLAQVLIAKIEFNYRRDKKSYSENINFNDKVELQSIGIEQENDLTILDYFVLRVLTQHNPEFKLSNSSINISPYAPEIAEQVQRELIEPLIQEDNGERYFSEAVRELWRLKQTREPVTVIGVVKPKQNPNPNLPNPQPVTKTVTRQSDPKEPRIPLVEEKTLQCSKEEIEEFLSTKKLSEELQALFKENNSEKVSAFVSAVAHFEQEWNQEEKIAFEESLQKLETYLNSKNEENLKAFLNSIKQFGEGSHLGKLAAVILLLLSVWLILSPIALHAGHAASVFYLGKLLVSHLAEAGLSKTATTVITVAACETAGAAVGTSATVLLIKSFDRGVFKAANQCLEEIQLPQNNQPNV